MDNVIIVRSRSRSSVGLQVLPDGKVKVTIPFLYPKFLVKGILEEKADWIAQAQERMKNRQSARPVNTYLFLGKSYQLETRSGQKEVIELEDKLYIGISSKRGLKTYLESWYKQQARKIIVKRVELYAKRSGATYTSIKITSAETRWGSCSSQKTLNFNWKLVMAPIEVIDYVVSHELAHLTEMNHSKDFWETVRKMYPMYREYRTWLKRHGHTLTI